MEIFPRSYDFFRGTGDLVGSERLGLGEVALGEDGGCCEYEDGVGITLTLTFVGVEGAVKVLSEITGFYILNVMSRINKRLFVTELAQWLHRGWKGPFNTFSKNVS